MTPRRPEIFISATTADLATCRERIKQALLTLRCAPVEQTNFPPDHRSVREMLRTKITACDAVVHLVGDCYGAEPKQRAPDEPRRSYTQLEYDLARELDKPVYVFVCGDGFPYDEHEPEDAEKQKLQQEHRAALLQAETLRYRVKDPNDLVSRVQQLQTALEELARELKKSHARFRQGLAVAIVLLLALGGAVWSLRNRASETAVQVAVQGDEIAQLRAEIKRMQREHTATPAVLARLDTAGRARATGESADPVLAAQGEVASQRGITPAELRHQLSAEGADVRRILAAIDERRVATASADRELSNLRRDALLRLARTERASAQHRAAVAAFDSALALVSTETEPIVWADLQREKGDSLREWADVSESADIGPRLDLAIAGYRKALDVYLREKRTEATRGVQDDLGWVLLRKADVVSNTERAALLGEAEKLFRAALAATVNERLPVDWASLQHSIAVLCLEQANDATGPAATHLLAQAVAAGRAALEIYLPATHKIEWAKVQQALGSALGKSANSPSLAIQERTSLRREAVEAIRAALTVQTREANPGAWAQAQYNLAGILRNMGRELTGTERVNALEQGVAAYRGAIEVWHASHQRHFWAMATTNLAFAINDLVDSVPDRSHRCALLAEAAAACRSALSVHSRQEIPRDWAISNSMLGDTLRTLVLELPERDRAPILRQAAAAYRAALEVESLVHTASYWAVCKTDLADALQQLGDPTNDAERIRALAAAEADFRNTLKADPSDDYFLSRVLAIKGKDLARADRVACLNEAIAGFQSAIAGYQREQSSPDFAADAQYRLGCVLVDRAALSETARRAETLGRAAKAFKAAGSVFTAEAFPPWHDRVQQRLAEIDAALRELQPASK